MSYTQCKDALDRGYVKFAYTKKDGSFRVAIGTRCPELLKLINVDTESKQENENDNICCYYDVVRGDWRSFLVSNFTKMYIDNMSPEKTCTEALVTSLTENCNGLGSCLDSILTIAGEDSRTEMMNFVVNNSINGVDPIEYEENLRNEVFPNAPVRLVFRDKTQTTQMSSTETKEELINRLIELRREEEEIIIKLLKLK